MNDRDSELIYSLLLSKGWEKAESESDADCILFNTCSVRAHAEEKVWSALGALKKSRQSPVTSHQKKLGAMSHELGAKKPIIGVIGCMGQNYKKKIFERAQYVDFVAGPSNICQIPSIIEEILNKRKKILATDLTERPRIKDLAAFGYRGNKIKALVSISHGCNNFCSYCIVPYVRGSEKSVQMTDIIKEVKFLAEKGYKEILLLGQNVNSYNSTAYSVERIADRKNKNLYASAKGGSAFGGKHYPLNARNYDFVKLLEKVNDIKGIERIRFMTSHPKDAHIELFKAMRDLPKVCGHLHLPLQSGSDKILGLMNRKYTSKEYLKRVEAYRKILPEGSLTTDIIIGFPGETESDFKKTYNLAKVIEFDSSFVFKYSVRLGTKANTLCDDVSREEKEGRNQELLKLQGVVSKKINSRLIGKTLEILAEGASRRGDMLTGRTRTNKPCLFHGGKELIGKLAYIKVEGLHANTLFGSLV